ncbi:MAG: hypothetical protein IJC02_03255 [Lachnospiraceae bacterium]|nr:hypothetical protein [Lachnospiraceae bacterium]
MSLKEEFAKTVLKGLESNYDLLELRNFLDDFRKRGMSKETMIEVLEKLRIDVKPESEDIILELLDFVVGFCNASLSIF